MVLQDAEEFPLLVKPFLHLFFKYYTITGELLTYSLTYSLTHLLTVPTGDQLSYHHTEAIENIYEKLLKRRKS